ncbi:uncharacterized protein (DUF1501 family) [Tumebacillus sp. BK434]|uniref:DUF1501 domain-containing protein n=1 Tax=Tumebacillus sp. BK434 TaxID=2512169 RepID=UPI00104778C8|nr:DUF1501 domain-containing protein [Tumebacillus sp. BK434]TCP55371.1 uncharacterized protein (DUF1501 family) [Tumebacillus sp. BK434]
MDRREFLKKSGTALLLLAMAGPAGWYSWEQLQRDEVPALSPPAARDQFLVVVQLTGGNDGLNTVVPYGYGTYYDNRATLALKQREVLALNTTLGLHPSLKGLKKLYDRGRLAVINGVGYPKPSRSHFRSLEIWQTAAPERTDLTTGWLGRYLDLSQPAASHPLAAVTVGAPSKIFAAAKHEVPAIESVEAFQLMLTRFQEQERDLRLQALRGMYKAGDTLSPLRLVQAKGATAITASDRVQTRLSLPHDSGLYMDKSPLAENLQLIARFIGAGIGSKAYFTQLGGFDDHAQEKGQHARLLQEVDAALSAFYQDLEQRRLAEKVTVVVYSEFGRRLRENASAGTDHGTAAPVFVLGGRVKGGLYGEMPSLTRLEDDNLRYTVDFRSVYATLLEGVLGAPSQDILGAPFEKLPIF